MVKHYALPALAMVMALAACGNKTASPAAVVAADSLTADSVASAVASADTLKLAYGAFNKENEWASVDIDFALPAGQSAVEKAIADTLAKYIDQHLAFEYAGEGDQYQRLFPAPGASVKDASALVAYYGEKTLAAVAGQSKDTYDEIVAGGGQGPAEKKWNQDLTVGKWAETSRYITFNITGYQYSGGAHGSVTGIGAVTFDKRSGKPFTKFLKAGSEAKMQKLLRKGLMEYFSEQSEKHVSDAELKGFLLIDSPTIPLPVRAPAPTNEGLLFTYNQYEIAAYAAGMPCFELTYDQLKPFLTDGAKALLLGE